MRVIDELREMHDVGFTDEEIGQHALKTRLDMAEAGFRQDEIDAEFGHPPFDPAPLKAHFEQAFAQVQQEASASPMKEVKSGMWEGFKAGFGESALSLIAAPPDALVTQDADMATRIAADVGSALGDAPFFAAGYLMGGGNPVTGMAAGMGLSKGIRGIMMDKYEKGEVQSFRDFWERAVSAAVETGKGYITGGVAGKVGQAVRAAPIVSPTVRGALASTGEIASMVAVGNALEGKIPEWHEFWDATITLGFLKGSAKVAKKMMRIYADYGIHPRDVLSDAARDQTIKQDLASDRTVVPGFYRQAEADALAKGRAAKPSKTPEPTGKYTEQRPQATIAELAKRMQPTVEKTSETGAFYPPGQPPVARVTPPYEARPVPTTPITELAGRSQRIIGPDEAQHIATKERLDQARADQTVVFEKPRALRTAEEILQERVRIRSAEEMILQEQRPWLRETKYIPPPTRTTPEEVMLDSHGRSVTTGEWLSKELEKAGIVIGENGEAAWEKAQPVTDAQRAILSNVGTKDPSTKGLSFQALYTGLIDNLHPIKDDTAYMLERLTRGTYGRGKQWIEQGVTDFHSLEAVTRGYQEIIAPVEKDTQGLSAYEISKRVIEKEKQGIKTGFDLTSAQTVVREGRAKYEAVHRELVKWRDARIDYMVESGLVNRADAAAFRKANEDYVPFHHLYEGEPPTATNKNVKNPIKRFTGNESPIQDPLVSDIKNTFLFVSLAERNAARQAYVQHPELATKVRAHDEPISKEEVKNIVQEYGVSDESAKAIAAIHPSQFRTNADEIAVFHEGERSVYKVDPAVAEAFQDLDRVSTNILAEMLLHTPANLLRAGVIVTPDYIMRNLTRDAVAAFIYAGSNPIKTVKGAISIVKKDTAYQKWLAGGGANATMVAMDRDYISNHLVSLNLEANMWQRAWNVARTPFDVMRAISEFAENSTRLGSVRDQLLQAKGRAAILALSMISRESTLDFSRHGKWLQEYGKMSAFFGPTVQGFDRMLRAFKDNPMATTAKGFASITLPSLLLWWVNRDDKQIQDQNPIMKDLFMHVRVPLPDGDSFILRIPMAHELGILFGTIPARLAEAYFKDNPEAFRDFEKTLTQAFASSLIPTFAKPIFDQAANLNPLSDGPLIPASQEKLLPEYQATSRTTELAKQLGAIMGSVPGIEQGRLSKDPLLGGASRAMTSPILIENYVHAWTGPTGMYVMQLLDKGLREAGVTPDPVKPAWTITDIPFARAFLSRYPTMSAQSLQWFHDDYARAEKFYQTQRALASRMDERAIKFTETYQSEMLRLSGINEAIGNQAKAIRDAYANPILNPDEKREFIDTAMTHMLLSAELGNDMMRAFKEAMK